MKPSEDPPDNLEIPSDREDIKRLVNALRVDNQLLRRALAREGDATLKRYHNERRLRVLVENAPICIHEIHRDGALQSMNPHGLSLLGARCEDEVIGSRYLSAVSPQDQPRVARLMERAFRGEASEFTFIAAGDGSPRTFASSFIPIFDESGAVERLMGCTREITAQLEGEARRRALEAQALQTQRLESLGLLAGGVAHDFNNLLTAVLGSLSLVQTLIEPDHEVQDLLRDAEEAAQLGARQCQQLLAYAGKGRFQPRDVSLQSLIGSVARVLQSSLPKNVTLTVDLAPMSITVNAVPAQLKQVLINLVANAVEAFEGAQGRIEIALEHLELDACGAASLDALQLGTVSPGSYAQLSVIDDGPGMSDVELEMLFEPFASEEMSSPRLGLAAVAGVVRSHCGALRLESTLGQGSRFDIFLPTVVTRSSALINTTPRISQGQQRKVLIVDDQSIVRQLTRKALKIKGFEVEEAEDGMQALAFFSSPEPDIDVVMLDIAMPGISGIEVLALLREVHPRLPVILCSGWECTSVDIAHDPYTSFLAKPFRVETLHAALEAVFEQTSS